MIRAMQISIVGLLVLYVAPLVLLAVAYPASNYFAESNALLDGLSGFLTTNNTSLSLVHRALLPLMAGMAPIAFKSDSAASWSTGIMLGLLAAIGLSIFLSGVFSSKPTLQKLSLQSYFGLANLPFGDSEADRYAINKALEPVYSFFNRTQETMSMYLLMLFGLTLAQLPVPKTATPGAV